MFPGIQEYNIRYKDMLNIHINGYTNDTNTRTINCGTKSRHQVGFRKLITEKM